MYISTKIFQLLLSFILQVSQLAPTIPTFTPTHLHKTLRITIPVHHHEDPHAGAIDGHHPS
jgi:hypothetical protein